MTKNLTVAQYKAEIKALNEKLRIAKSTAKIKKEFSEIFVNQTGDFIKYKNLSETKRFFEENYFSTLEGLKLTSKEFHNLLVEKLGL